MQKTLLSWSSGKDSTWSLHKLKEDPEIELVGIFTTINKKRSRVSLHGTRQSLLVEQAKTINLPLFEIYIPEPCDDACYRQAMQNFLDQVEEKKIQYLAFGDLYLEDVRAYRENQLRQTSIKALFPLWQQDTAKLAQEIIESGVRAIVTCVDTQQIPSSFLGREYDLEFLRDLPCSVDPCGENGEFHTFVYKAPLFSQSINVTRGQIHCSGPFHFIDLI